MFNQNVIDDFMGLMDPYVLLPESHFEELNYGIDEIFDDERYEDYSLLLDIN